jgi:tRNA 2-selenouridine synthase
MSRLILLTGLTGSGKTHLLQSLAAQGHQVIDLERLCRHRGSAFGGLNQPAQPSQGDFNRQLTHLFGTFNPELPVFLEQKGSCVGRLRLPDWLLALSAKATVIYLDVPAGIRIQRILGMYAEATNEQFADKLAILASRLPASTQQAASQALQSHDRHTFIGLLLSYYDAASRYTPPAAPAHRIFVPTLDQTQALAQILPLAGAFTSA